MKRSTGISDMLRAWRACDSCIVQTGGVNILFVKRMNPSSLKVGQDKSRSSKSPKRMFLGKRRIPDHVLVHCIRKSKIRSDPCCTPYNTNGERELKSAWSGVFRGRRMPVLLPEGNTPEEQRTPPKWPCTKPSIAGPCTT